MEPNRTIALETGRLILRPLTPENFEAAHSWAGDPGNTRYMAWDPNGKEQTKAFLASAKAGFDFAVVLKASRESHSLVSFPAPWGGFETQCAILHSLLRGGVSFAFLCS